MNTNTQIIPDNFFTTFPARMSDGRFMTDYRPNCLLNDILKQNPAEKLIKPVNIYMYIIIYIINDNFEIIVKHKCNPLDY